LLAPEGAVAAAAMIQRIVSSLTGFSEKNRTLRRCRMIS